MQRQDIAALLRIPRPLAARVEKWLRRLHENDCAHGECGIVPMRDSQEGIGVLIGTVDCKTREVGCAWCGEWQASHGEALQPGAVAVRLQGERVPHELRGLFHAAVLYCPDCWGQYREHLLSRYGL